MATRARWLVGLSAVVLAACGSSEPPPRSPEPPPLTEPAPMPAATIAPAPTTRATAEPEPTPPPVATTKSTSGPATSATPVASAAKPTPPAPPAAEPDEVEGANLRMSGMTADGVQLSNIQCRTEGGAVGGLFGGLTVAAGFKARKAQLDACAPKGGAETRVTWTATGGHMTRVKASGPDAKVNRCVERTLTSAPAVLEGACAATVRHGKP